VSKKRRKKNVPSSQHSGSGKVQKKDGFSLPEVSETRNPTPITVGERVVTFVELAVVCVIWLIAAFRFFPIKEMVGTFAIGIVYFIGVFSMYVVRAALEARRRYGKRDRKRIFYYSQMVKGDQKWSLYISLSFFAASIFLRWIAPSPNFNMVGIDIATSFYLGYIWTAKYKGEEPLPYEYMETVFLILTMFTNYIVYFFGR